MLVIYILLFGFYSSMFENWNSEDLISVHQCLILISGCKLAVSSKFIGGKIPIIKHVPDILHFRSSYRISKASTHFLSHSV